MFFHNPYFIILVPAFILAVYAQMRVRSMYNKYSQVAVRSGLTGAQTARKILDNQGLRDVPVEEVPGNLTDHYDPLRRVLRLSQGVYRSRSLAATGIAAHESGHAIQHARAYLPLNIRTGIFPVVSFSSWAAFPLLLIGFLARSPMLIDLGIIIFAAVVAFQIITLPVEFNASSRAIKLLNSTGLVTAGELPGARQVLNAAALTYLAAAAVAALQLIRLLLLRRR